MTTLAGQRSSSIHAAYARVLCEDKAGPSRFADKLGTGSRQSGSTLTVCLEQTYPEQDTHWWCEYDCRPQSISLHVCLKESKLVRGLATMLILFVPSMSSGYRY
eukprot:6620053-Pyramimonas_sp.AAC.1